MREEEEISASQGCALLGIALFATVVIIGLVLILGAIILK